MKEKWTRKNIVKYLYPGAYKGKYAVCEYLKNIPVGHLQREGSYLAGCIEYLQCINTILADKRMLNAIDFMKIVDGTFWLRLASQMKYGAAYNPILGESYLDFLITIQKDFTHGIFSDDYKFQELDPKGEYTKKEAAKYCLYHVSSIEKAKLEKVLGKDGEVKKKGKEILYKGQSIIDLKKSKKNKK